MPEKIWEIGASGWFYYKEICYDARSHERKVVIVLLSTVSSFGKITTLRQSDVQFYGITGLLKACTLHIYL